VEFIETDHYLRDIVDQIIPKGSATGRSCIHLLERMPASTWLGVTSLALNDLLVEIEATAVVEGEQDPDATES